MNSPPLFCLTDETLDSALNTMKTHNIYRLYVLKEDVQHAVGAIAYPDIVGMLYHSSRGSSGKRY